MAIRIPEGELPVLRKIASLGEPAFSSLVSAFGEVKPSLTPREFIANVLDKLKELDTDDVSSMLKTLFSLYHLKQSERKSPQKLAEEISLGVAAKEFPSEKVQLLRERLERLLNFEEAFAVTSKAGDVMTEHERIFCSARILSDIRPVFADSPQVAAAAVIIHNLQIGFHHNGEHKEFYVALDTEDIKKLKAVIVRAEEKTKALQTMIERTGVTYLEV